MSAGAPARLGSGALFDAMTWRYVLVNRHISLGVDRGWRRRAVRATGLGDGPARVLDLATGTGDLAIEIARTFGGAKVVGVDPSARMLEVAKQKIERAGLDDRIELAEGEAEHVPFEDGSFDAITMAFGIRNVADRPRALREMARVLAPGGKVVILELTEPERGVARPFARFHIHKVVPTIGAMISGADEYRYLESSIAAFPAPARFARTMSEAGLRPARLEPLTFGVAHVFVGERG
jgi:demethylmenaquinone methyltransferase/2-methoxy-6-polyprenyl-1,4-benzoquinol methylase